MGGWRPQQLLNRLGSSCCNKYAAVGRLISTLLSTSLASHTNTNEAAFSSHGSSGLCSPALAISSREFTERMRLRLSRGFEVV